MFDELKKAQQRIAELEDSIFQYGIENTKLQLLRDKLEAALKAYESGIYTLGSTPEKVLKHYRLTKG